MQANETVSTLGSFFFGLSFVNIHSDEYSDENCSIFRKFPFMDPVSSLCLLTKRFSKIQFCRAGFHGGSTPHQTRFHGGSIPRLELYNAYRFVPELEVHGPWGHFHEPCVWDPRVCKRTFCGSGLQYDRSVVTHQKRVQPRCRLLCGDRYVCEQSSSNVRRGKV